MNVASFYYATMACFFCVILDEFLYACKKVVCANRTLNSLNPRPVFKHVQAYQPNKAFCERGNEAKH